MQTHNSCGLCSITLKDMQVVSGQDTLLDNINLQFHCGELTALIGKNGAGNGKALLLPAGQGRRVRVPVLVKAKFFQQMYCTVFAFFRQFGIQQQLLRHTRRKKLR